MLSLMEFSANVQLLQVQWELGWISFNIAWPWAELAGALTGADTSLSHSRGKGARGGGEGGGGGGGFNVMIGVVVAADSSDFAIERPILLASTD
jgi:hypothetical protein